MLIVHVNPIFKNLHIWMQITVDFKVYGHTLPSIGWLLWVIKNLVLIECLIQIIVVQSRFYEMKL